MANSSKSPTQMRLLLLLPEILLCSFLRQNLRLIQESRMARSAPGCKNSDPKCLRYLMLHQAPRSRLCGLWLPLQRGADAQEVLCHTHLPAHVGVWDAQSSAKKHCTPGNRKPESLPWISLQICLFYLLLEVCVESPHRAKSYSPAVFLNSYCLAIELYFVPWEGEMEVFTSLGV